MLVDLDAIPRREPGLEPFEVMISESQERMCAAVLPAKWDEVREVCTRWGLPVAIIGRVTADGDIAIVEGGLDADGRPNPGAREIARIPASALTSDAIVHERVAMRPTHQRAAPAPGAPIEPVDRLPERGMDPGAVLLALLGSANLASRHAVFHQYDSTVGADTVAGPGRGAAVLRVKGTTKALVATTDGNHGVGVVDPWLGAALSVAEATRNVSITGARPLGVTNCLNYGDPTRPEAFWQLTEGVRGARRRLPRARPAGHRRQRLALQRIADRLHRADARDRGRRAARRRRLARRAGLREGARRDPPRRRGDPGLAGSAYASSRAPPRTTRRPSTSAARRRSRRSSARRSRAASSPRPRTSPAAASPSRSPRARSGAASARRPASRSRTRRRSTSSARARRASSSPAAPGSRRRSSCSPASTASRSRSIGTVGGDRLVIELAGTGATGAAEERGSRVADALEVPLADLRHAWEHGLARALGWEG